MADLPILFSKPMVRAILGGTKKQTRRAMRNPPTWNTEHLPNGWQWNGKKRGEPALSKWPEAREIGKKLSEVAVCPYGQPGDRLWVREAWKAHTTFDHLPPREIPESHVWYMADDGYKAESRYRQGMFMPRWASRITLEVTGVRVERLQDISEADCIAEGIERQEDGCGWKRGPISGDHPNTATRTAFPKLAYQSLWEAINGPESWGTNPWLWVVEFKRVTP